MSTKHSLLLIGLICCLKEKFKTGTADELAADEQVRKVYLGQNFELRK